MRSEICEGGRLVRSPAQRHHRLQTTTQAGVSEGNSSVAPGTMARVVMAFAMPDAGKMRSAQPDAIAAFGIPGHEAVQGS